MGRGSNLVKPQVHHLPDERQAVLHSLRAIVDARQEMGVEVASQDGIRRVVGGFLEKKRSG